MRPLVVGLILTAPVGCAGLGTVAVEEQLSIEEPAASIPTTLLSGAAIREERRGAGCPPGMVHVSGEGTVGMRGQPYGVVHTRHLDKVVAPEEQCAGAVSSTLGATACWVQTDQVDPVLQPRAVSVPDFCIEAFPFPGAGANYTSDGLTAWGAARLDELLSKGVYGTRRLCSASEVQLAVAGPTRNQRFVYGDEVTQGRCTADKAIGTDPACRNPETRVHEYGAIHSHWARADASFVANACDEPPCRAAGSRTLAEGMYVVMGGTDRVQTRQAPLTPHTWHDHGDPVAAPCDNRGWDDQPLVCATPSPLYDAQPMSAELSAQEAAWRQFVDVARSTGQMANALSFGLGRSVCEGS